MLTNITVCIKNDWLQYIRNVKTRDCLVDLILSQIHICVRACVFVCVCKKDLCVYVYEILYAAVYLGISIQHLSEDCDDIATCTGNSTTSPLANLIHQGLKEQGYHC